MRMRPYSLYIKDKADDVWARLRAVAVATGVPMVVLAAAALSVALAPVAFLDFPTLLSDDSISVEGTAGVLAAGEVFGPPIEADPNAPPLQRTLDLRLAAGNNLMETLTEAGALANEAHAAIGALADKIDVRRLQVGQEIALILEADPFDFKYGAGEATPWTLAALSVRDGFDRRVTVRPGSEAGYSVAEETIPTRTLVAYGEGVIEDSLFLSAERAGVPPEVVVELIRIFSFSVDFQREIRVGDKFRVYYERRITEEGLEVEEGNILYAGLVLRGTPHDFYHFDPGTGRAEYYDAEGKSARKLLMKTPIDGARLSSRYGRRKHPVLGYTRMHAGLDFATGRSGTPIYAAGDGVVERASRYGGYGNYVRIRHNGTYSTGYAHMSRYGRGIKRGVRVKQGQIIGYVGSTGLATGPHLHYEIYMNGRTINPSTLKLPTGQALTDDQLPAFQEVRADAEATVAALAAYNRALAGHSTLPVRTASNPAGEVATPETTTNSGSR